MCVRGTGPKLNSTTEHLKALPRGRVTSPGHLLFFAAQYMSISQTAVSEEDTVLHAQRWVISTHLASLGTA